MTDHQIFELRVSGTDTQPLLSHKQQIPGSTPVIRNQFQNQKGHNDYDWIYLFGAFGRSDWMDDLSPFSAQKEKVNDVAGGGLSSEGVS